MNIISKKMFFFLLIPLILGFYLNCSFVYAAQPLVCKVVINKSPEWAHHDVSVVMKNLFTQQTLMQFELPAAKTNQASVNSTTSTFDCQKYQVIQFYAKFNPPIWENQKNAVFQSKTTWNIQQKVQSLTDQSAKELVITINFPSDFNHVPELINSKLIH